MEFLMTKGDCTAARRPGCIELLSLSGQNLMLLLILAVFMLQGCARTESPQPEAAQEKTGVELVDQAATKYTSPAIPPLDQDIQEDQPKKLEPTFKELSPLDIERINISFVDEGYRQIFQVLARAAGLNLVLDPQLDDFVGGRKLTAEYQEIQVRSILNAICNILDIAWYEEHGTLFVEPFARETIDLDFLGSVNTSNFSVGGDVLGGGESGGSSEGNNVNSPLTGRFEIAGTIADAVTDIYTNIETTIGKRLEKDGEFILNRQTGTLMISGRPRNVREIKKYLEQLRRKYSQQVLIEAQIIEVNLDKTRELGIDWRNFALLASTEPLQQVAQTVLNINGESSGDDAFYNLTLNEEYYTVSSVFRALQQFGSLKILSNPRLKAMNGQSAVISVGQSVSYLKSLTKTTEGTGSDQTTELSTEISAIFDGILLGVTPVIKSDNSVTLHIVPIKSEIVDLDQQQLGADDAYRVTFPKVNLREISTVVNIKPKNLVILGGLIMEQEMEGEQGVPILSDIPLLGWIFKSKSSAKHRVEMVIILKVDVLNG